MRRLVMSLCLVVAVGSFVAPSPAFAQQSLNVYLGGFVPRGEDTRVDGDVLLNDLDFFLFDIKNFNGGTVGGVHCYIPGVGSPFDHIDTGARPRSRRWGWPPASRARGTSTCPPTARR